MTDAATLLAGSASSTPTAAKVTHALSLHLFAHMLGTKRADELTETWGPIAATVGSATDWWPDVPVVMGELEGGEAVLRDSGLAVESDRLLLRVLGKGGAP